MTGKPWTEPDTDIIADLRAFMKHPAFAGSPAVTDYVLIHPDDVQLVEQCGIARRGAAPNYPPTGRRSAPASCAATTTPARSTGQAAHGGPTKSTTSGTA